MFVALSDRKGILDFLAGHPLGPTSSRPKSPPGAGLTESRLTSLRLVPAALRCDLNRSSPTSMPTSSRRGLIAPNRAPRGASGGVKEGNFERNLL